MAGGAVLPGAKVTITNMDTGEVKEFTTNGDGIYDTVSTPAGNYSLSFEAAGFKKLVQGPVALQVDVITQDANLEVGSTTETVTVNEGAPLLETETSKMGAILDAKTIQELPQIGAGITGNDWANFNILLPGAAGQRAGPASVGRQRRLQCGRRDLDQRQPAELRQLPAGWRRGAIARQQQRGQHGVRGGAGSPDHDLFVLRGVRHRRSGVQPDHQGRDQRLARLRLTNSGRTTS